MIFSSLSLIYVNNIIFFPIKEEKSNYWLNFNKVQNYEKSQNGIAVLFKNGEKKHFI